MSYIYNFNTNKTYDFGTTGASSPFINKTGPHMLQKCGTSRYILNNLSELLFGAYYNIVE